MTADQQTSDEQRFAETQRLQMFTTDDTVDPDKLKELGMLSTNLYILFEPTLIANH